MAGTTFHKKENYILRLPPVVGNFGQSGIPGYAGKQGFLSQGGEGDGSKSGTRCGEEVPAVEWVFDTITGHD